MTRSEVTLYLSQIRCSLSAVHTTMEVYAFWSTRSCREGVRSHHVLVSTSPRLLRQGAVSSTNEAPGWALPAVADLASLEEASCCYHTASPQERLEACVWPLTSSNWPAVSVRQGLRAYDVAARTWRGSREVGAALMARHGWVSCEAAPFP